MLVIVLVLVLVLEVRIVRRILSELWGGWCLVSADGRLRILSEHEHDYDYEHEHENMGYIAFFVVKTWGLVHVPGLR